MPKVSVVVPVYNVEAYLPKCVESILAQTERDLELLLIDDGSTDGSGPLCDELAKRDPRVRAVHQENRGLGGARNTGIDEAAGDWLLFIDSDDWIEPETLERSLAAAEREHADLVVFGYRTVDETGRELQVFLEPWEKDRGLSPKEHKELFLIAPSAANKLYRKSLFSETGIRFPSRVWYEDLRTTPKLMAAANAAVLLDYVGYNYFQRQGSIMQNSNVQRNGEILDAFDDLLGYFRETDLFETYRDELCWLMVYHGYITAATRVIRLDRTHPLVKQFGARLREEFPDYRTNRHLSLLTRNQKIIYTLLEKKLYFLIALIFQIKG